MHGYLWNIQLITGPKGHKSILILPLSTSTRWTGKIIGGSIVVVPVVVVSSVVHGQ